MKEILTWMLRLSAYIIMEKNRSLLLRGFSMLSYFSLIFIEPKKSISFLSKIFLLLFHILIYRVLILWLTHHSDKGFDRRIW